MSLLINLLSGALIAGGCFFVISGALGILRMPDLYTRIHAASVIDTGGAILIIAGLLIQSIAFFDSYMTAIKLIIILFFINFSAPTASHAIARLARMTNRPSESEPTGMTKKEAE